jgi:photosystem II stability/assembly factor-like uncharacterized protein
MPHGIRLLCATLLIFAAQLLASNVSAQNVLIEWTVSEFQPDVPTGGRASTITVNPANYDQLIVASESGGLFRSTDRGVNWKHIDGLPEFSTFAVAYVPADPNVVIATVGEDMRVANGGGIWRSTDGGFTWTQMPGPSAPAGVPDRLSAYEISIAPDNGTIYIGTQYGVSISHDNGATWTHVDVFGTGVHSVRSVLGQRGNHVLAGGPAGISRSSDEGTTWLKSTTYPALSIPDIHALGGSPFSVDQAYVMNQYAQLYYTEDGGNSWTWITPTPVAIFGCGGIPFVKAIGRIQRHIPPPSTRSIDLYVGNRCRVSRLSAPEIPGTGKFDYSGTWTTSVTDHLDTRDLAFTPGRNPQPLLLATDGGLHKTTDGGLTWHFTGGGTHGYNALQINEVKGQWITSAPNTSAPRYDLYFGTQDNGWSSSPNLGATWATHLSGDAFYIELQHRVATAADSKTTFTVCGAPCDNWLADPLFTGAYYWPDPASPRTGAPKIVRKSFHVEAADSGPVLFGRGLAVTTNLGSTWSQYALFPEDWRDLPKLSDPGMLPVLYQSVRTGFDATHNFEIDQLVRIEKSAVGPGGSASYPLMNNFGGLGINPAQIPSYQVFAVDPGNTQHLIAPDVVNEKMMETMDGGDNWSEIASLTSLVTDGGQFLFRRDIFPQASAISFSPDDPNMVAIGTWQAGMFVSPDRGVTWYKIPGTDPITRVTSIEWRTANDAIVSTYGRGLWRIQWKRMRPLVDLEKLCKAPCIILPIPPVEQPIEQLAQGVLVFGGTVQGGRVSGGILKELFVMPGSLVVFLGDAKKRAAVKVTESRKRVGLAGVKLPKAPERNQLVGLTMGARGTLIGAAFSDKTLSMYEPSDLERNPAKQPVGQKASPTAGKPYLTLTNLGGSASNAVGPEVPIKISARKFPRGALIEIALDQKTVERLKVGDAGEFAVTIRAPAEFGLHTITARDAATGSVIDGTNFIVKSEDTRSR